MCFDLCHTMQIKARLNPVQTALEPLGTRPVDPGKAVECRRSERLARLIFLSSRRPGNGHRGCCR
jgi:hypothetical protein